MNTSNNYGVFFILEANLAPILGLYLFITRFIFFLYFLLIRFPVALFLNFLSKLSIKLKARVNFENRNIWKKDIRRTAKACFHISSQGELEQVYSIIESILKSGDVIELIYTSSSVEDDVLKLKSLYLESIDILRLPVLDLSIFSYRKIDGWVSAPTICLCRYDFFPELLYFNFSKKMILLNARAKNKGLFYSLVIKFFDIVVAASDEDSEILEKMGRVPLVTCDYRVSRISSRQHKSILTNQFLSFVEYSKKCKKKLVVLGSAWPEDLEFLIKLGFFNLDCVFFVFPHRLDNKTVSNQMSFFKKPIELEKIEDFSPDAINLEGGNKVIFIKEPGILCDLYPFFDLCFVGGGFGKGIHSVLEPYIGGCDVLCGPNISRSSEFSFIKGIEPKKITSLSLNAHLSDIKFDTTENFLRGKDRLDKTEKYLKNQADDIKKFVEVL